VLQAVLTLLLPSKFFAFELGTEYVLPSVDDSYRSQLRMWQMWTRCSTPLASSPSSRLLSTPVRVKCLDTFAMQQEGYLTCCKPFQIIDSARRVCGAGSMKRSSICLSHWSTTAAACGGFAAECLAGRRYRSFAAQHAWEQVSRAARAVRCSAANASSVMVTADIGSWTQTCSQRLFGDSVQPEVTPKKKGS